MLTLEQLAEITGAGPVPEFLENIPPKSPAAIVVCPLSDRGKRLHAYALTVEQEEKTARLEHMRMHVEAEDPDCNESLCTGILTVLNDLKVTKDQLQAQLNQEIGALFRASGIMLPHADFTVTSCYEGEIIALPTEEFEQLFEGSPMPAAEPQPEWAGQLAASRPN